MNNVILTIKKLEESGYSSAMYGLSLNKKQPIEKMEKVSNMLCKHDNGHNKFLEFIYVWLEVIAPRYWWAEADTYRLTTKQSESTIHTLAEELNGLQVGDLDDFIKRNFEPGSIKIMDMVTIYVASRRGDFLTVKRCLPEGYLQKRIWCLNYKTLRNIIIQRKNHKLPHWRIFINSMLDQVNNPELLPKET